MESLKSYLNQIQKLCIQYHVLRLYVFGSILTNKFNQNSDIDFLVDFDSVDLNDYADNYFDFKYSLQELFQRNVDLLESKALTNPYLMKNIEQSKQLIYG
ncbi:MAG: nucleotidyltransferase [Ignavibacteria bacterium GWF2_33_9]|nr:MAG: nucleotidyltransferase [Ignavibacteria bacterium GWF2_33_9]